jgi:hypothetical protein
MKENFSTKPPLPQTVLPPATSKSKYENMASEIDDRWLHKLFLIVQEQKDDLRRLLQLMEKQEKLQQKQKLPRVAKNCHCCHCYK